MQDYFSRTGTEASVLDIAIAADNGDDKAIECLTAYQDSLARGLASVINVFDPDIVVLGGGLSNLSRIYVGITELIDKYAFSDGIDTPVVSSKHGDSSGVRGAAWLWPLGSNY